MTNPDDLTAYLKAKLEDRNPKCGNCRFWDRTSFVASTTAAPCHGQKRTHDDGRLDVVITTDLSLCSAWEKRET